MTTSSWSTLVAVNALVHEMFPPVAAVLPADTQARRHPVELRCSREGGSTLLAVGRR